MIFKGINRVIRYLVAYEFMLNFAFGLLAPIFAVFALKNVQGSTLVVIGLSTSCYWLARILTTVPFSRFMDRTDGERDEYYFLVFGSIIVASVPFMLLFAKVPWHLYLIFFIHGLGNSMAVPGWRILFTDHVDEGHVGYEWSIYDIAIGLAVGSSAYLGALFADIFGFEKLLILLSILGYVAVAFVIPLYGDAKTLTEIKRQRKLSALRHRRSHEGISTTPHVK